jgi:hypothetical protein
VVSSPPTANGEVVVFNLTTWRFGCDENCMIMPGEHPFVAHKTVVAYELGLLLSQEQQQAILKNAALCPQKDPVSEALLAKIQRGALVSDLTPQKLQDIIRPLIAAAGPGPQ